MRIVTVVPLVQRFTCMLVSVFCLNSVFAQSNVTVRIMAANLNGNTQSIQPFAIDIFKGLKPDVVCIQEFNYSGNTAANFRALIDDAFGTNFSYYRETGSLQIPNGIISRYPIIASGRWVDTQVSNRGFAWAQIDLPGSNDLYAVSVHLLTSGSGVRATEANNLKTLIQANFPTNAWVVIGGDFNTDSRGESAITTLASLCPDSPIPTDAVSGGDSDSNANRNKPYDYVLASRSMTNYLTNVVFASHSFPKGLVFDSRVYTPLSDVSPIVYGDSGQGQHMAILKDFSIPVSGSNAPVAPVINNQPQSQTIAIGVPATFNVTANGTAPLSYQWRFNGTNILGAITNSYTIASAQTTNNGSYVVVITNSVGSVTSSAAILTVSNTPPVIVTPPADQFIYYGETAAFSVVAGGTAPLIYQWRFNGTNISGATNDDYNFNNAQTNNAGNYSVVVTNLSGSITSAAAVLTVSSPVPVILTNPAPLTVVQGASASFTVVAGGATPLEFQWRFNGTNIVGADTNPFTLSSAQLTDAGNYSVVATNIAGSVTSSVVALTVNLDNFGIIAQWNFNSIIPDGTNITGSILPSTGSGTASLVGGVTTNAPAFASGDAVLDPSATIENSAWNTTTYPALASANKTAGVQFAVSTASKQNISVSWSQRSSNSGGKYFRLLYSTNSGSSFVDFSTAVTLTAGGAFFAFTNNLASIPGVNNNSNVIFRIIAEFQSTATGSGSASYIGAGGTYQTTGTTRFDMVTVSGSSLITATPAALAPLTFTNGVFTIGVTGTVTASYVVQTSTNLSSTNWLPVFTNVSPFSFTESNLVSPQKFYRAVVR